MIENMQHSAIKITCTEIVQKVKMIRNVIQTFGGNSWFSHLVSPLTIAKAKNIDIAQAITLVRTSCRANPILICDIFSL